MDAATDPFLSDIVRRELAGRKDLPALRSSYENGTLPELEDLSSTQLWDELASCSEVPRFRIRRLQAVADRVPAGASVLDIGVGWGEIIPMILSDATRRYSGIDFSEQIAARAAKAHPSCRFYIGGLEQVQESYDAVLALEVCEHILPSRIFAFYEQIKRLLRDDGRLIITVPLHEDLRAQTLRCPHCSRLHNRMGHVRAYTPELIAAELTLAGFTVDETFFIYANFDDSILGRLKRYAVDLGRYLLNLGTTLPLNVVMVARKKATR